MKTLSRCQHSDTDALPFTISYDAATSHYVHAHYICIPCSVLPRIFQRRGGVGVAKWNALVGRGCFKHGRGHLSGVCCLCGAVIEQHRVFVFGLKC